ncbi:response regulator [bacterium]|nr:response regulator [bacterium]
MKDSILIVSKTNGLASYFVAVEDVVEFHIATTGAEAIRTAKESKPLLIFINLFNPPVDVRVVELIHQLKQAAPACHVIGCTKGYDIGEDEDVNVIVNAVKAGMADILELPSFREELIWMIDRFRQYSDDVQAVIERLDPDAKAHATVDRFLHLMDWKRSAGIPMTAQDVLTAVSELESHPAADMRNVTSEMPLISPDVPPFSVLAIEDEPDQRENLLEFIQLRYEGEVAATVSDGLDRLRGRHFDVVLLDIALPDLKGNQAIPIIKSFAPDVDIIMVTAYRSYELVLGTIQNGASDYILKPYRLSRLQCAIANVIQRRVMRQLLKR